MIDLSFFIVLINLIILDGFLVYKKILMNSILYDEFLCCKFFFFLCMLDEIEF